MGLVELGLGADAGWKMERSELGAGELGALMELTERYGLFWEAPQGQTSSASAP